MAQDQIKRGEIIQDGLFNETTKSAQELKTILDALKISFANVSKETGKIFNANKSMGSAKEVNELTKALEKQETIRKTTQKAIERERLAEIRLAQAREKAFDNFEKKLKKEKDLLDKQNSAYNKLAKSVNELRKQYKDVAVSQGENSKAARTLLAQLTPLDAKLKQIDANAGQFQRNVGNYPKVFGVAANAVRSLASAFGLFFGLQAVVGIFRSFVGTFREFEDVNVRVASVLGTTTENTKQLTEDAKRLGATTARSATEVLKLQEAYARLGFSQSEIINLTEPTINGSIALNSELDKTAELVGAVVNSFDAFESANAPEILDAMTLSTQKSALNFSFLETALPTVAAAANSAGVPFNELLSLLGKLADGGLDASTSATSLRNIFIESSTQGKHYTEMLDTIANSTDALVDSNDEFGKRGAVAATILSAQSKAAKELEEALDNAGGTSERVANENLKTLSGAVILLKSAWEGFMLSLEEGNGTFGKSLQTIVRVTTEILSMATGTAKVKSELNEAELRFREIAESIIRFGKAITAVVAGYAAFRVAIIATNTILKLNVLLTRNLGSAKRAYITITNLATIAQQKFNAATKANVIGAVVGLLISAATAMALFKSKVDDSTNSAQDFNDTLTETDAILANVAGLKRRIDTINQLSKESLKILKEDIESEVKTLQDAENEKLGFITERQNLIIRLEKLKEKEVDLIRREELRQSIFIQNEELSNFKATAENIRLARESLALKIIQINKKLNISTQKENLSFLKEFRDSQVRLLTDEEEQRKQIAKNKTQDNIDTLKEQAKKAKEEGKIVVGLNELILSLEKELSAELLKIIKEFQDKRDDINKAKLAKFKTDQELFFDAEIIELETQLLKIEDITTQAYKDLQERILNLKVEQLQREIEEVKTNTELSNAEKFKQEQDLLFQIESLRKKETVKIDKTELDLKKEMYEQSKQLYSQYLQFESEARNKAFELEQQERDRQTQIQSDRAAAGLKNNLAFQEAESKKAALVRKQELEKEQRRREALALSETYLNALNANLKANEPLGVANAKALATTFAARGIAKGLQFFNEGTEYVEQKGKKSPFSKGKDTVPAMLAVGEGVVKTDANINNPGVVAALNKGVFQDLYAPRKAVESSGNNFNAAILLHEQMKTNQLLEKIASKPNQWISQDVLGQIVEKTYHKSHTDTTTYKRSINPYKR